MRFKIIILQFILLAITGYTIREKKKENTPKSQTEIVQSKQIPDNLKNWADDINNGKINNIKNSYDANAIKIIPEDSIIENSTQIAEYYKIHKGKITSIESIFSIEASKERGINYQLVKYKMDDLKEFIGIVIWRKENERIIREFKFTEKIIVESKNIDSLNIAIRRKLWIQLCNENNAENLVKELYTNNTMYFNHKPVVKGAEKLIKEYSYMNNENYNLNLHPIKLELVNANLAFEVGQCSGSYKGKYILVWKKHSNGNWKVLIDSNI
jgi:ketosteroid isomerase-like protein